MPYFIDNILCISSNNFIIFLPLEHFGRYINTLLLSSHVELQQQAGCAVDIGILVTF